MVERLRGWLVRRGHAHPANNRGTVRPQQGLEYLCARIIASGIVLPPRNIGALHEKLFDLGVARPFGTPLKTVARPSLNETEKVAHRVCRLMGVGDAEAETILPRARASVTTKA